MRRKVKAVEAAQPKRFSPYQASIEHGAIPNAGTSGINWSYFVFPSEKQATAFGEACNAEGYRTRNLTRMESGWAIQYHHYQD